jgi:hypothetical protein
MDITIAMVATIDRASIGISTGHGTGTGEGILTGGAMTHIATGSGRSEVRFDTIGAKRFAITMPINGKGVATGRALTTGVADDSTKKSIFTPETVLTTFGAVVIGCHRPITRLRMSCATTPLTNCQSRHTVAGGSALTITWYY